MSVAPKTITVFAPAKINLFLHLTGRLSNDYHALDSLVSFADIGDYITIETSKSFSFNIDGEFAKDLKQGKNASFIDGDNIIIKAARAISQISDNALNIKITLNKNLPVSSGIGGGSSDAAATIWALQELWNIDHNADYILPLMIKLGADVPVCQYCRPAIMQGIGDVLLHAPDMPEIPILLINPMISCSTSDVFLNHNGELRDKVELPKQFKSVFDLVNCLKDLDNDLFAPAIKLIPEIENIINALQVQDSCLLARMSGSGATCFGLFETMENAKKVGEIIKEENPDWWVKTGWLNRPERY